MCVGGTDCLSAGAGKGLLSCLSLCLSQCPRCQSVLGPESRTPGLEGACWSLVGDWKLLLSLGVSQVKGTGVFYSLWER